jgi:predicted transposase YdaD
VLEALTGFAIDRWHNVELPEVRSLRADMIGESKTGAIVHIELQSTNDADMALRMAEYALALYRLFRQFPQQVVLYVGKAPLRMPESIDGPSVSFRCRVLDIRQLDGEPLLDSSNLEDNLLAVLMRLTDEHEAVRKILRRIAESEPSRRDVAVRELLILAELRHLGAIIEKETRNMPILDDIMDHEILGPAIRRGLQQGRQEGRQEGEQAIVMRQIEKRFGAVPVWARQRLEAMSAPDIEEAALRLLDAHSLEELLGN